MSGPVFVARHREREAWLKLPLTVIISRVFRKHRRQIAANIRRHNALLKMLQRKSPR